MQIFKFNPILKTVIWGGSKIALRKGIVVQDDNIGESWELSGVPGHESVVAEGPDRGATLTQLIDKYRGSLVGGSVYDRYGNTLPLLIKFIDANQDLSVQVHPNDELAFRRHNCCGKTEMWYILESEPQSHIYVGLNRQIDADEYAKLANDGTIMDVIADHESNPGDVFFLPAGRIHAIGAGNLLLEIQQTSDITYRIYDYGRLDANGNLRQLHTAEARDAIDYTVYPDYVTQYDRDSNATTLCKCNYFCTRRYRVDGDCEIDNNRDSFMVVVCTEGSCQLSIGDESTTTLDAYHLALVPAQATRVSVSGKCELVTVTV